ncbi:MAG: hypothetical protein IPL27_26160 [Lewinellaceae bacterium]|nr:hypothetical protein [Lewinellaceae bacterium]
MPDSYRPQCDRKKLPVADQVGIGRKTIIEDNVVLYGQVGYRPEAISNRQRRRLSWPAGVSQIGGRRQNVFGAPAEEVTRQILRNWLRCGNCRI